MPRHYPRFDRVCIIEGCGKPGYCRGWCGVHYDRWKHHGDPLGGGTGHGEARQFFDDVVTTYNGPDCLIWPYGRTHEGYGLMNWQGRPTTVHRLMCIQENGPPPTPKHEAAHSCGEGSSGCVSRHHVSWKTRRGNAADKVLHGTSGRGEKNKQAKLTLAQINEIHSLKGIKPQKEIAALFGISNGYVSNILSGRKWAWVDKVERRQRA